MITTRLTTFLPSFLLFVSPILSASISTDQIVKRDKQITFTIYNKCDKSVQPMFHPSLPGHQLTAQGVIHPNDFKVVNFTSNDYRGYVYTKIHGSKKSGTVHTTHGEFDVQTGKYAISLEDGFNVGMYLQLKGKQAPGPNGSTQCDGAKCDNADCQDAYHQPSGLLTVPNRQDEPNDPPMHQCPPDFTNWFLYFCPSQEQMIANQPLDGTK